MHVKKIRKIKINTLRFHFKALENKEKIKTMKNLKKKSHSKERNK